MGLLGDILSAFSSTQNTKSNPRDNSMMNKAHDAYNKLSPQEKEAFKQKSLFAREWDDKK